MRRPLIHLVNAGILILVFIMFPAITRRNLGSLRLSDHSVLYQLTVAGLCAGILFNTALAWTVARTRKDRALCWGWAGLLGSFLLLVVAHAMGWLHFRWLKEWLLWANRLAMGSYPWAAG
jgi:hypothetical protein